jgi:hypothetical protein
MAGRAIDGKSCQVNDSAPTPVAEHGVHQRQGRNGRGICAHNPRAKRYRHHERFVAEPLALAR